MNMDWLKVTAVVLALVGLLCTVRRWGQRYCWPPEWQRKTLHVALGLTALTFPWLFAQVWPVLVICGSGGVIMLALRRVPALRRRLGRTLHDVNRTSTGELLFALAIALLFALAHQAPVRYVISLAILTLADTAAALVGARWGKATFAVPDGEKSWAGVAAFGAVTGVITFPLLLGLTERAWPALLLITLSLTALVTMVEALAWHGQDNLLIPLGGYLALTHWLPLSEGALLYQLAILIGLTSLAYAWRGELAPHTVLTALVTGYCLWLGGPLLWLIGLLGFLRAQLALQRQPLPTINQPFDAMVTAHWLLVR